MATILRELRAALGLGIAGAGCVLVYLGTRAGDSFASSVTRLFSGSPTKEAVLLTAAGIALIVMGLVIALATLAARGPGRSRGRQRR